MLILLFYSHRKLIPTLNEITPFGNSSIRSYNFVYFLVKADAFCITSFSKLFNFIKLSTLKLKRLNNPLLKIHQVNQKSICELNIISQIKLIVKTDLYLVIFKVLQKVLTQILLLVSKS